MTPTRTASHATPFPSGPGVPASMLSPAEYARAHGISAERVRQLCRTGRIQGATQQTLGPMTMWLIPSDVADPRLPRGRPAKPKLSLYQPDADTQREAGKRLRLGRREARAIIAAMKKKGVKVKLFGSMETGQTTPHSDIDLLITDPGPLGVMRAISETLAERLTLPLDVVAEATIGRDAFARIQESLHA